MKIALFACFFLLNVRCFGQRITISLDGTWDIADSLSATERPAQFIHHVVVPGLVHSAEPGFPAVDLFESREHIVNLVVNGALPRSALVTNAGIFFARVRMKF